ncbi:MAG: alpha/beta fold hydrolase [Candidatus Eremiobacteraeota bacterium]|nr:alpha/beta fold hydrolase [Candidatus Eremiobacteraeota bacterium]
MKAERSVASDTPRGTEPQRGDRDTFSGALGTCRNMLAREGGLVHDEGRSLLLAGDRATPEAYVLLHGLTTTPAQFVQFAQALHERGANVFAPLLPRHGLLDRMTASLAELTDLELTAAAREIVEAARGLGMRLNIVGFSLGGTVAAWIAQNLAVDRVVAIAPFLGLGWVPTRVGRPFARAMLRSPNLFLWWHPLERERHAPLHGYPRYATHAVARAWRLGLDVVDAAGREAPATHDIALVVNESETTVNNRTVTRLARSWRQHRDTRVILHRLRGLPRSHDIMEPRRHRALAPQVYPALLEIVSGNR